MNYQTVILTGLDILEDQINEIKEYLFEKTTELEIFKFDFKHLNYFLSDIMFNQNRKEEFDTFKSNTLIIWIDKSKAFKEYQSEHTYHNEINASKTSLKLISNLDNIFFNVSKDNLYIDIIPNVMKILTCEQKDLQTLLFELN
jgi:hypothetical protein